MMNTKQKLKNYKVQRFITNDEEVKKVLNFLYSSAKLEKNNMLHYHWEDNIDQIELSDNSLFNENIDIYIIIVQIPVILTTPFQFKVTT